jgi:hypothetical protein
MITSEGPAECKIQSRAFFIGLLRDGKTPFGVYLLKAFGFIVVIGCRQNPAQKHSQNDSNNPER